LVEHSGGGGSYAWSVSGGWLLRFGQAEVWLRPLDRGKPTNNYNNPDVRKQNNSLKVLNWKEIELAALWQYCLLENACLNQLFYIVFTFKFSNAKVL